jgi:hypothetical protein
MANTKEDVLRYFKEDIADLAIVLLRGYMSGHWGSKYGSNPDIKLVEQDLEAGVQRDLVWWCHVAKGIIAQEGGLPIAKHNDTKFGELKPLFGPLTVDPDKIRAITQDISGGRK